MIDEKNFGVYINILCQTLQAKNDILNELLDLDHQQEDLIKSEVVSVEDFQDLLDKKAPLLDKLNNLDSGFELSYNRIKDVFVVYKDKYKKVIQDMQANITQISQKVMEVQRIEVQNREGIQLKFHDMRQRVKTYNVSSKSVSNYYKNMSNAFIGEAQFMDKKK